MANRPWIPAFEKVMALLTALCVIAILVIIGLHAGVIPGCKTVKICG